jgi:hypothetical protein
MTKAATKLARLLRAQGYRVRVRRHAPARGICFCCTIGSAAGQ